MVQTVSARQTSHLVATWLLCLYLMVFAMVIVGGTTRLTGSGLSMVQWHPLMGALPPLSESDWVETFQKYQASPQYKLVNRWMLLSDFKRIFLWEYAHRLLGRLIGVFFFVPWLFFLVRRRLDGPLAWKTLVAFLLGGAQGLLGWFMVKSGLVDNPEVSHYGLAAHLVLALVVGHYLLWLFLDLRAPPAGRSRSQPRSTSDAPTWSFIALLALQIVFGALMAGKHAGLVAATFPDMNGEWVPSTLFSIEPWWRDPRRKPDQHSFFASLVRRYCLIECSRVGVAGASPRRYAIRALFGLAACGSDAAAVRVGRAGCDPVRSVARSDRASSLRLHHALRRRHPCTHAAPITVRLQSEWEPVRFGALVAFQPRGEERGEAGGIVE